MMTKKDYQKAAEIARSADDEHRAAVTTAYIELFRDDNPRFDVERFSEACMLKPVVKRAKR